MHAVSYFHQQFMALISFQTQLTTDVNVLRSRMNFRQNIRECRFLIVSGFSSATLIQKDSATVTFLRIFKFFILSFFRKRMDITKKDSLYNRNTINKKIKSQIEFKL